MSNLGLKIDYFSLQNLWILGFLTHIGFSIFFLSFPFIGIEYVYQPKQLHIECRATENISRGSIEQIDFKFLTLSTIQWTKWKLHGLLSRSCLHISRLLEQYNVALYPPYYYVRKFWVLVQRGPPTLL